MSIILCISYIILLYLNRPEQKHRQRWQQENTTSRGKSLRLRFLHTHIHNILYSFKCTWWGVAQIFNIIIIMSAQQTTRSIDYLHDTHAYYIIFFTTIAGSPTSWCGDDGAEAARVYRALMYRINDMGMGYILTSYDCKCTRDGLVLCVINRIETRAIIIIYHYLCVRAAGETYRVM